ncbi:MAG: PEP-CTERM sorting domain-containing protein [Verrucomicrobia bacterium]|nr:PEP-CTERM sorting domain-containing protein [Verrucomicrobiota bacterium]
MKASLPRICRWVLGSVLLSAALGAGADEGTGTVLSSVTLGGYVSTGATFESPADTTLTEPQVIGQAQDLGLIVINNFGDSPYRSGSYPGLSLSVLSMSDEQGMTTILATPYAPAGGMPPIAAAVPEPSTISVVLVGAMGLLLARRGQARQSPGLKQP